MDNKQSCPLCGKKPLRLILFACLAILLAGLLLFLSPGNDNPLQNRDASSSTNLGEVAEQPFTLDLSALAAAEPIPVNIKELDRSASDTDVDGKNHRTILITPQTQWQGDFTAARIVATMLETAKTYLVASDVVTVYLLPLELNNENMYAEAALGCLTVDRGKQTNNILNVQTRGYLPQELEFMAVWDKRQPEFIKSGKLNREGLTQAVIRDLGDEAYGMAYPFMSAKKVDNIQEVFAAGGIAGN